MGERWMLKHVKTVFFVSFSCLEECNFLGGMFWLLVSLNFWIATHFKQFFQDLIPQDLANTVGEPRNPWPPLHGSTLAFPRLGLLPPWPCQIATWWIRSSCRWNGKEMLNDQWSIGEVRLPFYFIVECCVIIFVLQRTHRDMSYNDMCSSPVGFLGNWLFFPRWSPKWRSSPRRTWPTRPGPMPSWAFGISGWCRPWLRPSGRRPSNRSWLKKIVKFSGSHHMFIQHNINMQDMQYVGHMDEFPDSFSKLHGPTGTNFNWTSPDLGLR